MVSVGWTLWALIFLIAQTLARSYLLHTNEIVERHDDSSLDLPTCTANSICGYLQANSHGINSQQRCACGPGFSCPLTWDSSDGHSITQGSDQYKFCGHAPQLTECRAGMTAYTSRIVFSKESDQVLLKSDHIHCICPENYNHVLSHQQFDSPDDDTEGMDLTYICAPLEPCEPGDFCKTISETTREFLVQRKCLCPDGFRCPTNASRGVKTTPMGSGLVHFIRCQR